MDTEARSLVGRPVAVALILLVAVPFPDFGATQSASNVSPPEARAALLDASRPEQERVRSLVALGGRGEALDSEMLAAAVDLGAHSPSATNRALVWQLLGRMASDPALVEPLSEALLSDADQHVRREAAFALAAYREEENAQRVLANAMRNDSLLEIRLAAQMSMMDRAQQLVFARERLHDPALVPGERLWPKALFRLSQERGPPPAPQPVSDAEMADALAIAEVVSLTDDATLRMLGLQELQSTFTPARIRSGPRPGPEITRVMIDSSTFEDFEVRRAALSAMLPLSDDPGVRAALEAAVQNDPELAARLRIPEVLSQPTSPGSPAR